MMLKKRILSNQGIEFSAEASLKISEIIHQTSGIYIKAQNNYLIQSRLQNRLNQLDITDLNEYVALLRINKTEVQVCIELLTTHKTDWFREIFHFKWLKEELKKKPSSQSPIYIWSAACSTGAEVYSLMFLFLKEGFAHSQFRILGTDISNKVLERAVHLPEEPEFILQKEFLLRGVLNRTKVENELELALLQSINFKQYNLVKDQMVFPYQFDVIFLRNVLIYFDRPTVLEVCRKLMTYLKPYGHLVIGISESIQDEIPELKAIGNSIYQYRPVGIRKKIIISK